MFFPKKARLFSNNKANFSSIFKEIMSKKIPIWKKKIQEVKKEHGAKELSKIKFGQVLHGMQGISTMFYTASILHPKIGVTYRGYSIEEVVEYLPKAKDGPLHEGDEPLPEALFWLLVTGDLPTPHEYEEISSELKKRGVLDDNTKAFIQSLSKEMPLLTQLSSVLLYLQPNSAYQKAFQANAIAKGREWEFVYEDTLDIIAKLPYIAASIYKKQFQRGDSVEGSPELDWSGNFAHMLGYNSFEFREYLRGYMTVYADHDGGDVSSHTNHLLGTAHVDPFLAYSSAINAMAGPLHGFANKQSVEFLIHMHNTIGERPSEEKIKDFLINHLSEENSSVPGYGHTILTHIDSRFLHLKSFIEKHIEKTDSLIFLAQKCYKVLPGLLKTMKNEKNPWPNVDALSGVLLKHYGLKEKEFFIVITAVARSMGCMANLIVTRALEIGVERPMSINLEWLDEKISRDQGKIEKE